MLTKRIENLKSELRGTKPSICIERARLVTEFYQKCTFESTFSRRAHLLEYLLKNMTIYIRDDELIVGNHSSRYRACPVYPEVGSKWILEDMHTFDTRTTDPLVFDENDKIELKKILEKWNGSSFQEIVNSKLSEEALEAVDAGVITIGSRNVPTASHVAAFTKLFSVGLNGIIKQCREQIAAIDVVDNEIQQKKDLWESMIISCQAVIDFAGRYADLAEKMAAECSDEQRKSELLTIAENCRTVPAEPPKNFWQAAQFFWFTHLCYQIESNGHNHSFGRFDQYMYPFYKKDIEDGTMTDDKIEEIIENLWINITSIFELRDHVESEAYAGYPMWINLTIGGIDKKGRDACNELTYLVLDATENVQTTMPAISFRYNKKEDYKYIRKALELTKKGLGQPAFFNDDVNIPLTISHGATIKEAREYAIVGCVEPAVPEYCDFRPVAGFVNFLKIFELTIHNGYDPIAKKQIGLKTGDISEFTCMDDILAAYKKQIQYFIKMHLNSYNMVSSMHTEIFPEIFASSIVNGTIESGKTLQAGGAKFSYTGTFVTGVANAADSLAAIEEIIFNKKMMSLSEMMQLLDSNWEGKENYRLLFKNKAPKYGNNIDMVDNYANWLIEVFADELPKYRDSRNGMYTLINLSQSYNIWQGRRSGATPDGRRAFDPLADNASPTVGYDQNGPTSAVMSVAKIDQLLVNSGTLLNQKFDPAIIKGEKGYEILDTVIKTYFDNNGEHIQINVVDVDTLRKAQKEPDKYRNLMVRVAGYSAYFVELDKAVQENIINRTTHTGL